MSWRTKGEYLGLGDTDRDWLTRFDRAWDTKRGGRSRTDAFEHMAQAHQHEFARLHAAISENCSRAELEALLIQAALGIERFTVPRQTKAGWSIHLVLKDCRRIRIHFKDLGSAMQAYDAVEEYSLCFPKA